MPTLRRLEVFAEAAVDCSFRKTADRLNISQAGLSNHILLLERELGYALFERRRGSTPRLTPAGASLLNHVRATLEAASPFMTRSPSSGPETKIRFNVCARNYMLQQAIIPSLEAFNERHPMIDLEFHAVDHVADILARVAAGACDIGLFRGTLPVVRPPLRAQSIGQARGFLFVNPDMARQIGEEGTALADLPFLLPKEGTDLGASIDLALARNRISPTNIVARSQFPEILANWVVDGRGASLLFESHMSQHVAEGRAVALGPALIEWDSVMVSALNQRDPQVRAVVEFFRETVGGLGLPQRPDAAPAGSTAQVD